MKREDGSQPLRAWLLLWPYFLLARFSFWLYRLTTRRSAAFAEVVPGLWFSRRLTRREAQSSGVKWAGVLDLAAEFPRAPLETSEYRSLPLLDGAAPTAAQLRDGCGWIMEQIQRGPVLVHCALGHGRTGSVVLAWLVMHGHVPDLQAGVSRLVSLRKGFGLSTAQSTAAERAAATRSALQSTANAP